MEWKLRRKHGLRSRLSQLRPARPKLVSRLIPTPTARRAIRRVPAAEGAGKAKAALLVELER
eukprot:4082024-Pyramimonas_sp.AAC.1